MLTEGAPSLDTCLSREDVAVIRAAQENWAYKDVDLSKYCQEVEEGNAARRHKEEVDRNDDAIPDPSTEY